MTHSFGRKGSHAGSPGKLKKERNSVGRRRSDGRLKEEALPARPIADHSKNEFLDVCDFLIKHPELHNEMLMKLSSFHVVDLALMFQVRGRLFDALRSLMTMEYQANKARGVATETFRTETGAVLLVSAVMSLDNVLAYRQVFISECVGLMMTRFGWSPKVLGNVVKDCIKHLHDTHRLMPEELVTVIRALHDVAPEMPQFQASLFFLRFLCPGLAQPITTGGLDRVPDGLKSHLLELAKALQLISNRVDPAEHAFSYPIASKLRKQYEPVSQFFVKISEVGRGAVSPPVTKSLVAPARATIKAIKFCNLSPEAQAEYHEMSERLGPFSEDKTLRSEMSSDSSSVPK